MTQNIQKSIIKKSLIYETVQLFAAMAMADGIVTKEESEYIKKYYHTLYPKEFAEYLFSEFNLAVKEFADLKDILDKLQSKLSYNNKIILLIKLIELMAADEIVEVELKMLYKIANKFNVSNTDIDFFIKVMSVSKTDELKLDKKLEHRYLIISNNKKNSDVYIEQTNIDIIIINVGKILIMIQKDKQNMISIDNKKINPHFAMPVFRESEIRINQSYEISQFDLKYYFRQLKTKNQIFYLEKFGQNYTFKNEKNEKSLACIKINKCKIFINPLNNNEIILNKTKLLDNSFIDFNNSIFSDDEKINIKTLVLQNNLNVSFNKNQDENYYINIGNRYEYNIFIDDDTEQWWNCKIEYNNENFDFHINNCPFPVYVNNKQIKKKTKLALDDKIQIWKYIISYNSENKTFERHDNTFNSIKANNLFYKFNDNNIAIDNVSFQANKGEFIGIMGSSGCGKTTLLNILNGFYKPTEGSIKADSYDVHKNNDIIRDHLSYVPQDDLLFENLTVYENLYYNAKLRYPTGNKDIKKQVNRVLRDIGLYEKKDVKVGDPLNKVLSGGERKRVNIGLELLSDSDILLLDEPTSGLSSKDSEKIMKILQNLSYESKIIFVVIHQPSQLIYQMFNKTLILDRGGKLAYFGESNNAYKYFETFSDNLKTKKQDETISPDFILDTLEQPIRDIDGKPLPIRKYSPEFWKTKFTEYYGTIEFDKAQKLDNEKAISKKAKRKLKERLSVSFTLLQRNFINKLRDKTNIIITFLLPPLLGLGVGQILKYSPNETYSFFENQHVPTFMFLFVLIAVFLGITNSIEEIIKDQKIILREKMLNISKVNFYNSKIMTLIPFAIIQNILFFSVGYFLMGGREFYIQFIILGTLVSITGISIGLFISSIPKLTSKAAINIIPLILIPQIVFGGGLIRFQDMNHQLVAFENSPIPEICQLMPSRWGFEAILVYQGKNNRYQAEADSIGNKAANYREILYNLNMEQDTSIEMKNKIIRIENTVDSLDKTLEEFDIKYKDKYGNGTVQSSCKIDANQEYQNYIDGKSSVFPMFIDNKVLPIINKEVITPVYNILILLLIIFIMSTFTIIFLKIRFK